MLRAPVAQEPPANDLTMAMPQPAAAPAMQMDDVTPYVSNEFVDAGHVHYQKKRYTAIILAAIGALLLIAATLFFFYRYYVRTVSPPPAAGESGGDSSGETPSSQ
jgi:hypothetical protein